MSDLQTLFPEKTVTIMGEDIIIRPFSFVVCMTKAAKLVRSFAGSLTSTSVLDIIADGGEDVLKLVQLAVDKPKEWWDALPPDAGLELTATVLEVNRDFFVQRLLEPLKRLGTAATGATSLPDSSAPVIDGTTSSDTPTAK